MDKSFRLFNLLGAVVLTLLLFICGSVLLARAAAPVAAYPEWRFNPLVSFLPPGTQSAALIEIGEQGELVVTYFTNGTRNYGVAFGGVLTRILAIGDPAPGGGVFVDLNMFQAYAASPTLVYFATHVHEGGQDVLRYFRWNSGALANLPTQSGQEFDFTINDAHGKFISKLVQGEEDTEYRITDGVTFSAPITLHIDNTFDNPQTRQTLIGVTADGAFLVRETFASGTGPCGGWATSQMRLFWLGNRSGNVVTGSSTANGCGGSGTNIETPVMNSAGDILGWETSYNILPDGTSLSVLTTLHVYPGDGGASSMVAQGEQVGNVGPYWGIQPKAITEWRQPIFIAQGGVPSATARLYSGPNPSTDAFDGDFLAGFGQDGTPQNLYRFSEKGFVQVYAELADSSADFAIGNASTLPKWMNPVGGSWGNANNWSTGNVPGAADEVLFGLAADYAVNFGERDAGRVRIEDGFVTFNGADLTLLGPLSVSGDATFELASGTLDVGEMLIGALPPTNPANPSTAHVQIVNPGTILTGTTVIMVGEAAPGSLFVEDAEVHGGPLSLGNAYAGSAILSGSQTEWFVEGGTSVGYKEPGVLSIENGAYLRSGGEVIIGRGETLQTNPAVVEVRNLNAPPPALGFGNWLILDTLTLGDFMPGELYISQSGQVLLSGDALLQAGLRAHPGSGNDAFISLDGSGDTLAITSTLTTANDVLLGMADQASVGAQINVGGYFEIALADLYLGYAPGSEAVMTVAGRNSHDRPALLRVIRPAPLDFSHGICIIGENGVGQLLIHSGGQVECGTIRIGGQPGGSGFVQVDGANGGSTLTTEGALCIGGGDETGLCGEVAELQGELRLKNSASVSAGRGTVVGAGGKLTGSGDLAPGTLGLIVEAGGVFDPGSLNVLAPSMPDRGLAPEAGIQTGVLQISGSMTVSQSAQVKFDILGPERYDQLVVSGALQLEGGTLVLNFANAYAPQQGDTFEFLLAGSFAGDFTNVQISGLQPGFQYELDFNGGQLQLTALNDGVPDSQPNYNLFLPMVSR